MTARRTDANHATEHQEQAALFVWMEFHQAPELSLAFAVPNGGKRDIVTAMTLRSEGVKPGVPDIFLPVARGGYHGLFIELKAGRGRPTPEQSAWLRRLTEQGYLACCVTGWEAAKEIICEYMGIEGRE